MLQVALVEFQYIFVEMFVHRLNQKSIFKRLDFQFVSKRYVMLINVWGILLDFVVVLVVCPLRAINDPFKSYLSFALSFAISLLQMHLKWCETYCCDHNRKKDVQTYLQWHSFNHIHISISCLLKLVMAWYSCFARYFWLPL